MTEVESDLRIAHAHFAAGRLEDAEAVLRRSAARTPTAPSLATVHYTLGRLLAARRELDEAIASFERAIELKPDFVDARNGLGNALLNKGRLAEAVAAYDAAIALRPGYADAHNNRGIAMEAQGKMDEAVASFRRAVAAEPKYAIGHNNLGVALRSIGRRNEAIEAHREAARLKPDCAEALTHLGNALREEGRFDEAEAALRRAVAARPEFARAHTSLGNVMKDVGRVGEAIASYRLAVDRQNEPHREHSNLVYAMHFHPDCGEREILAEQLEWARRHTAALPPAAPHENDRTAERRLRVGYVSGDFRNHVVGRNILPLLREHDRSAVEVHCYSTTHRPADEFTRQFREYAAGWRLIAGISDERAAEMVRADRIDVLVDLSLHMAGNRLMLMARKPAPVQMTFAGYPGGTGLAAIDYRLSDPHLDPPVAPAGQGEQEVARGAVPADPLRSATDRYIERTIRLPHSFWCYDPSAMEAPITPPVAPLPAAKNGYVTFGCLNNFCKMNAGVLAVWGQVMARVLNSRLILLAPPGSARRWVCDELAKAGVEAGRVSFVGLRKRSEYLKGYDAIDIGLDTFPYNGHTTSLDAYWMGVPVVTLAGRTAAGRAGVSHLTNLGLAELVAREPVEFVRIASGLAGDLPRLADLRAGLRSRMLASPICDAKQFARGIEAAFRWAWQAWCVGR